MKLEIPATSSSPLVVLDTAEKKFLIQGRSLPEVGLAFYDPIIVWLNENVPAKCKNENGVVEIMLDYCNTASYIGLTKLFKTLERFNKENDCHFSIKWYYDKMDEDWLEDGRFFEEIIDVPFEFLMTE